MVGGGGVDDKLISKLSKWPFYCDDSIRKKKKTEKQNQLRHK